MLGSTHRSRRMPVFLAGLVALVLTGCCTPCTPTCARVVPCPPATRIAPTATQTPIEQAADTWVARARDVEPRLTALLVRLASEADGDLVGLEHRLKTRKSLLSKIERLMEEEPGAKPDDVEVYDAVRYTMRVDDQPPGHHDQSLRSMLRALEAEGHSVVKVKNYWPRGDSYNGVNCVMRAPGGLPWEIQFHTRASYATKQGTHTGYERMRESDTPAPERRQLFESMTATFDALPIPEGILEPGSLHEVEQNVVRPAP